MSATYYTRYNKTHNWLHAVVQISCNFHKYVNIFSHYYTVILQTVYRKCNLRTLSTFLALGCWPFATKTVPSQNLVTVASNHFWLIVRNDKQAGRQTSRQTSYSTVLQCAPRTSLKVWNLFFRRRTGSMLSST